MKILALLILILASAVSAQTSSVKVHVLRLKPGQDALNEINAFITKNKIEAASILSVVGSLTEAHIRFANKKEGTKIKGELEVVSMTGTTSIHGSHIHLSVSDGEGKTLGGHLLTGNKIYTTLEIVLGEYPELTFKRALDPTFGYNELDVQKK